MRCVLQRVSSASVSVSGGSQVSCIGPGLLLLVGIRDTDTRLEAEKLASKVANVRIWPSDDGSKPWHESVTKQGSQREVLCVSQFTLYGDVRKGNKPDWHHAMAPTQARELYDEFKAILKKKLKLESDVKDGVFGAKMDVSLVNDGPITLFLEYENESANASTTTTTTSNTTTTTTKRNQADTQADQQVVNSATTTTTM